MKQYCVMPHDGGYFVASGLLESHNVYNPARRDYVSSRDELVRFFSDLPSKKMLVHLHSSIPSDLESAICEAHAKITTQRVTSFLHPDSKKGAL